MKYVVITIVTKDGNWIEPSQSEAMESKEAMDCFENEVIIKSRWVASGGDSRGIIIKLVRMLGAKVVNKIIITNQFCG